MSKMGGGGVARGLFLDTRWARPLIDKNHQILHFEALRSTFALAIGPLGPSSFEMSIDGPNDVSETLPTISGTHPS
jgi:hypothetical protein